MKRFCSLLLATAALTIALEGSAGAQTLEIKNAWRASEAIVEANGAISLSQSRDGAQWTIEKVRGVQIRLRNTATGAYLAGDASGRLFTTTDSAAPGTIWWLRFMDGDPKDGYRINLLSSRLSLHVENGALELSEAPMNWWSAIWLIPGYTALPLRAPSPPTPQQQTAQTTPSPVAGQQDDSFNPFADDSPQPVAPQPVQTGTVIRPAGGGTIIARQSGGNSGSVTTPAAPMPAGGTYEGVWIERDWAYREEGDGLKAPKKYRMPSYVTIASDGPSSIEIRYHDQPVAVTTLEKRSETSYAGSGDNAAFAATFEKAGESYFMTLTGPGNGPNGRREFQLATTLDGVLARDRFDPEVLGPRESRTNLFASSSTVKDWRMNFNSFDGLEMDLFDSSRGVKAQIFKQPGAKHYALEDNMQENLPYGLRGFVLRRSSFKETEVMITNAAEFKKGMSFNFGGGGDAKAASLGANFSYEKTQGTNNSSTNFRVMGIGRMERYVLITDLPTMELADGFRADLQKLIAGTITAPAIIARYGTHYANSVTYGGLSKAEKSVTSQEMASFAEEKWEASAKGSAKGANLSGGYGETSGSSNRNDSMFSQSDFVAVGGIGTTSAGGHAVGDNDTVPVRYDLYPLSDLLTPIFFTGNEKWGLGSARAKLRQAIDQHMDSAPAFSDVNVGPKIYRAEFKSLSCISKGDESSNEISMFGKIYAMWHSDSGVQDIVLFDEPNGKSMSCGRGAAALPINKKALIVISSNTQESRKSGFGNFAVVSNDLHEDDNSFDDLDDKMEFTPIVGQRTQTPVTQLGNGKAAEFYFGGANGAPTLILTVQFNELK